MVSRATVKTKLSHETHSQDIKNTDENTGEDT